MYESTPGLRTIASLSWAVDKNHLGIENSQILLLVKMLDVFRILKKGFCEVMIILDLRYCKRVAFETHSYYNQGIRLRKEDLGHEYWENLGKASLI